MKGVNSMILDIANRIQYLRDKAGMTQTDLAKRLGISRSAVNSWEMSLSSPSLSNIVEMMNIFHVSADYLISSSDRMLIDISSLSGDEQEVILKMIACLQKQETHS